MVTVSEAATLMGLSVAAIEKRLQRGDMRGVKVNPRLWLIPREEVEAWRKRGRLKPGPKPRTPAEERRQDEAEHDAALDKARRRIRGVTAEE